MSIMQPREWLKCRSLYKVVTPNQEFYFEKYEDAKRLWDHEERVDDIEQVSVPERVAEYLLIDTHNSLCHEGWWYNE